MNFKLHLLLVLWGCVTNISAQNAQILKDIGPGDDSGLTFEFESVSNGSTVLFPAYPGFFARLWATDGTEQGTHEISTISLGNRATSAILGNQTIFNGFMSGGEGLYLADIDKRGEELVRGFEEASIVNITALNDTLAIFLLQNDGGIEVWNFNLHTVQVDSLAAYPIDFDLEEISFFEDYVVFTEESTRAQKFEPFMTDGTRDGTLTVSAFIQERGQSLQAEVVFGEYDILVFQTANGQDYFYYNGEFIQTFFFGDLKQVLVVGDKRLILTTFGIYEFSVTTELINEVLAVASPFTHGDASSNYGYFINSEGYVTQYDPVSGDATDISAKSIGSTNFDGFVVATDSAVYYWVKQTGGNELREVNIRTLEDRVIDTVSVTNGLVLVPEVQILGDKILYTKATSEEGYEWWVYSMADQTTAVFAPKIGMEVIIYPNPAAEQLLLSNFDIKGNFKYLIYDNQGRLLKASSLNSSHEPLEISFLNAGSYYIQLTHGNRQSELLPFIKI